MEPACKKSKREQTFSADYASRFKWVTASKRGPTFAHCTVCESHFSISHGGAHDIQLHGKGKGHMAKISAVSTQPKLDAGFFKKKENPIEEQVLKAEISMVELLAEMNLPLTAADKLTAAVKKMFPDSEIAKKFSCGRTKATAIAKDLAKIHQESLFARMKAGPFTLSTDGSNDSGQKLFPMVVRTVNPEDGSVSSELLSLPFCEGSATGEAIFQLIDAVMTDQEIPWCNLIAFGCDNASVMTGIHKGVFSFLKKKNPSIFLAGCTLHLVHLASEKATALLPVDPADLLIDIYYYFQKSSVRQKGLSDFQALMDVEQKSMLKHVSTRWLSIGRCLDRLIDNWEPLRAFFKKEKDNLKASSSNYSKTKVYTICDRLTSSTTLLHIHFLRYAVTTFDTFLTGYQSEAPKITLLHDGLCKLLRNVLLKFVKPSAMAHKAVLDVDYESSYNLKNDGDLMIGSAASDFLKNDKSGLTVERKKEFYLNVKAFYSSIVTYLKANLPFQESLLKQLAVVNPGVQVEDGMVAKLEALLERFTSLSQGFSKDQITESFALLQASGLEMTGESLDKVYSSLMATEELKPICVVFLCLLTIPHSSAHCERIFSCVRKNKTDFRPNLGLGTLEALLVLKHQSGIRKDLTTKQLKFLKGSCVRALQAH